MNDRFLFRIGNEIKLACIRAARDASMSGLCTDGASEAAVSAIERINIEELLNSLQGEESDENAL